MAKKKKLPFETKNYIEFRRAHFRVNTTSLKIREIFELTEDYEEAKKIVLDQYVDELANAEEQEAFYLAEWICELRGIPTRSHPQT